MIDLKKCNYITGQSNAVFHGISKIVDFFDNSGKTPIFICSKNSNFHYGVHISKLEFEHQSDFQHLLQNKSNLFQVDIIIVDLWFLSNVGQVISYKNLLDKLNINYIILTNKYHYVEGDENVNVYKIESEVSDKNNWRSETKYWIKDLLKNSKSTIDNLVISFIRNKKIDDIIDPNAC